MLFCELSAALISLLPLKVFLMAKYFLWYSTMSRKVTSFFLSSWGAGKLLGEELKGSSSIKIRAILCLPLFFGGVLKNDFPLWKDPKCYLENIQSPLPLLRLLWLAANKSFYIHLHWLKANYSHIFSPLAMSRELVLWKITDLQSSAYSPPQEKSYRRSRGCDLNMSKRPSPHQRRPNRIPLSLQSSGSWGKSTAVKPLALTGANLSFSRREEIKDKPD